MKVLNPSRRLGLAAFTLCVVSSLSGCSFISDLFPDKQKQYRYSTEIQSLEIPPDLTASTIEGATQSRRSSSSGFESGESSERPPSESIAAASRADHSSDDGKAESAPAEEASKPKSPPSTLAENTSDVPLVEIDQPFDRAWNSVAKALGRMELEVSDQNRSEGTYYVYYGAGKNYKDRGFLGDVAAIFGGEDDGAQEYRIKLEERASATSVYVLDKENKPQSDGKGLELLKSLHQTLQTLSEPRDGDKS